MTLTFDVTWLAATVLLAARIAGATALVPVFGPVEIPGIARVLLAFALAGVLATTLGANGAPVAGAALSSSPALAIAMLAELVIGASLAFGFLAAYAASQIAGRVLDVQMGFGAAGVINPATREFAPVIGALFGMVAIAAFLALDGHLLLVRALAASITHYPPGSLLAELDFSSHLAHSAVMFTFGLTLAAPVMFALLLADIAIGVMSRSVPQLNAFVLGFALKIVLGLMGLAAAIALGAGALERLFSTTFDFWQQLVPSLG
jgi:flagellar biosynthesis protein FliR